MYLPGIQVSSNPEKSVLLELIFGIIVSLALFFSASLFFNQFFSGLIVAATGAVLVSVFFGDARNFLWVFILVLILAVFFCVGVPEALDYAFGISFARFEPLLLVFAGIVESDMFFVWRRDKKERLVDKKWNPDYSEAGMIILAQFVALLLVFDV